MKEYQTNNRNRTVSGTRSTTARTGTSSNIGRRPAPDSRQRMAQNKKRAQQARTKRNIIIIAALILIILIAAGISFAIQKGNKKKNDTAQVTTSAVEQAIEPSQTEPTAEEGTTIVLSNGVTVKEFAATKYSTEVTLNVRSGPGTDSSKVGMIGQDTPIKVTGECDNGWYRIEYDGNTAYISAKYVADTKDGQTTAPSETTAAETTTAAAKSTGTKSSKTPYYITVNRSQNIVTIYQKDSSGNFKPVKAMVCSVGLNNNTPTGTFSTTDKYTWRLLSGGVYGQYATRITGHILFHSVPYYTQAKDNLESEEYNKLGQAASLGCVRLAVQDAKWIYDNCPKSTTVEIYDSSEAEPLGKPSAIKIDLNDSRKGWDPTDPDAKNPWKH